MKLQPNCLTTSISSNLQSMITIRTKNNDGKYKDFQVRAEVVRRALEYLKENNPFYFDIEISTHNLQLLPDNGNVFKSVVGVEIEDEDESDVESLSDYDNNITCGEIHEENFTETSIPMFGQPTQKEQIENVIQYPTIGNKPIDEFTTIGYVVQAFPCLFPNGTCDLRSPRDQKISDANYFKHLMRWHDGRFAKHSRFRFFAMNSLMRWNALKDGNIFVQRNPEFKNVTVKDLKQKLKEDPSLIKKIMFQASNLRGTKPYWRAMGRDLETMIQQIGLPTLFITLSAADLHWPDLFRLLAPEKDPDTLSEFERRQLVKDNPMIVDEFFLTRVETFLQEVLIKKFHIKDYWFRIEYQHRGSPHLHGVLWLEGAPDISNLLNCDEEQKQQIIDYYDSLVSTTNPDLQQPPAPVHPSRVKFSDVQDLGIDLAELLNKVQRHTKCTDGYCLKMDKVSGQKKCRFGFPVSVLEASMLDCSEKENIQFLSKRNDPKLNKFNPYIIQTWRANMDISAVTSLRKLISYLAKYISKSETKSEHMIEILKTVMDNTPEDKPAKSAIQRLFIRACSERDYSAQETCHLELGFKLCSSGNRKFISINFNDNSQWLRIKNSDSGQYLSFPDKYKLREKKHENKCLWYMAKHHNITNKKCNIVRVFPNYKLRPGQKDNELYYEQQCLLFIPWTDTAELKDEKTTWQEVYEANYELILANRHNSLALPTDVHEEESEEISGPQDLISSEEWMALSRMGPENVMSDTELGLRDIDLIKDWHYSLAHYESIGGIPYLQNFLSSAKEETNYNDDVIHSPDVVLTSEQQQVLDIVSLQIKKLQKNLQHPSSFVPKTVLVQGKAGTGKSLVISKIQEIANNCLGPGTVLILGPTGVCAANINGATIHSALKINDKTKEFEPLHAVAAHELQRVMEYVRFVIIDEFKMVGCTMLYRIDQRLRQATGKADEQFGGLNIYLFGDIKQLAPVGDTAAYSHQQATVERIMGKQLFNSLEIAIVLQQTHRQQNKDFLRVLNNISFGEATELDYDLLKTRFTTSVDSQDRNQFFDALHLYSTKLEVQEINNNKLESLKNVDTNLTEAVVKISAIHNCQSAARGSINEATGLEPVLYLAENATIMLRANIWTARGLVNGAIGEIVHIVYHPNSTPSYDPPAVLICRFKSYKCPYLDETLKTVPIIPITKTWTKSCGSSCSRTQFPITLAYAMTIHKSQGLTLDKAFVNIGSREMSPGLSYVALSRVKSLNGLLLQPFSFKRLQSINASVAVRLRKVWEQDLINKQFQTCK